MNRDILFKAIREYDKKWVVGNLVIDYYHQKHILPIEDVERDGHHLYINSNLPTFFIQESFCQFVIKMNGEMLFEGDYDGDGNCLIWCEKCNGWEFGLIDIPTKEMCIPCHNCEGNFFFEDHINDFRKIGNRYDEYLND